MPNTILTEENLKEYLTENTGKINFENFYWLSNNFIAKLGKMCPNLQQLSLRRMPQITNKIWAEMFEYFRELKVVDFCDCDGMVSTALNLMLRKN